jgi:glutamate synthase (NADPH/NADH) small chain
LAELAAEDADVIEPSQGRRARIRRADAEFSGDDGKAKKPHCVKVDERFKPPGTEFDLDAELVLLAMGFVHPVYEGLLKLLGVDLDRRGNIRANLVDY